MSCNPSARRVSRAQAGKVNSGNQDGRNLPLIRRRGKIARHAVLFTSFTESCPATRFSNLEDMAKRAGYAGLCCLYLTGRDGVFMEVNEKMWVDFGDEVLMAVA